MAELIESLQTDYLNVGDLAQIENVLYLDHR